MPARLKKQAEIYSLASHHSFVDGLVQGIYARFGDDPLGLGDLLILLPNRRAVRSLRDAFLRASGGKSMILPHIEPIGDVDEDELFLTGNLPQVTWDIDLAPPIPPFIRQMLLMDIIERWTRGRGEAAPEVTQCALLARALGQFLDHVQTQQLTFRELEKLVPSEYAVHWQQTLDFLKILTEHWPDILSPTGFSDQAVRRNILLDGLSDMWLKTPPSHPVIVAGSTGSIPATARLLSVVSRLPKGLVLLPGLDLAMDQDSWDLLDDTHPQATMKCLLDTMNCGRQDVKVWLDDDELSPEGLAPGRLVPERLAPERLARGQLLREVMRPAATTDRWRYLDLDLTAATEGLSRLNAPGPREEAGMIALMLREVLETEGKTAALVTPDRQLARRVAGEMKRWDILIDDSAGTPLSNTVPGLYLRLTAQMVGEGIAPVPLLSVLKHPLSAGGQEPGQFRKMARLLEEYILRGPRPAAGCAGIALALKTARRKSRQSGDIAELDRLTDWWRDVSRIIRPFEAIMAQGTLSFEELLVHHVAMAERLSASCDRAGPERLWQGDAGEEAAGLIEDLHQAAPYLKRVKAENYPALLDVFMGGITVRPKYGRHPRLNIWGPLEARLQQADLVILAGLNEGSWPPEPAPDPWMSRPMRKSFGLPSLEQKIGLSAHDFLQAASAPQVVLIRSEKQDGTPTVKSRWLSRLDAVAPETITSDISAWLAWYRALDRPEDKQSILPPRPMPPVASRPRKLSVTRIEKWMQDPYSIYAAYILKLKTLDPLDADPGAADKGTIIHDALEGFMAKYPDRLPHNAAAELIRIGDEKFESYLDRPLVRAFWWPRFIHVAEWFVETEKSRRLSSKTVGTEITGQKDFDLPGGVFTLTAKADRIDRLGDGSYSIIDYKTGQSPTARKIYAGYAPQLPLEGLMATGGNFKGLPPGPVSDLSYWQLKGGEDVAKITSFNENARNKMDISAVIKASFDGLVELVNIFDRPDTAYLNNPRPDNLGYGEYDHLARTKEWQGSDLGDMPPGGDSSKKGTS